MEWTLFPGPWSPCWETGRQILTSRGILLRAWDVYVSGARTWVGPAQVHQTKLLHMVRISVPCDQDESRTYKYHLHVNSGEIISSLQRWIGDFVRAVWNRGPRALTLRGIRDPPDPPGILANDPKSRATAGARRFFRGAFGRRQGVNLGFMVVGNANPSLHSHTLRFWPC